MTIYVNFTNSAQTAIDSVFSGPQDETAWPNQGTVEDTDARYLAFTDPTSTLTGARTAQNAVIDAAYADAIAVDVSFTTAAGVIKTYQADTDSQALLLQNTQAYTIAGAVPTGFYWRSVDNTQVSFTLADLQGLNAAVIAQDWAAFQTRSARKDSIAAATTVADVEAITWAAATTSTSTTSTSST